MSDPAGVAAPSRARPSAAWYVVPFLVVLTVAARLPAFFSSRHLVIDDGVYGVSVVDMRHGLAPYTGVFSAQGPLHFPLLYVGDLIGLRTLNGPRVTPMLAGIAATIAVWAIARRLAGPTAGLIAGALVATSGSMIWTTGQVTGDGPASALAVCAVWAALAYRDDPGRRRALVTGLVMGAALAVKPLLVPAAIPVGWWLWSRRRIDHLAIAIGAAIALWFASALPWGLGNVWRQSVTFNSGAGPRYAKLSQLNKLLSTLGSRDLLVVAALVLALITVLVATGKGDIERDDITVIAVWAAATALVLVLEPALYRNHLAAIVPPLALLAAVLVRTPRALLVVLVLLVPWSVHNLQSILRPTGYRGDEAALMQQLRALPSDAQVISDDPGFVFRAGLRTPRLMNDASAKRIAQHLLTTASVAHAAADSRVCAVVVWTTRFGRDLPGLPAALRRAGLVPADRYRGHRVLWLRPRCS
ncbi:MAG: hypothetical protein QOG50_1787 [Actinomycetota bacterium]|jgi:hypothetical protein|nr:hypothetical protein [Actinomycetota bacterium]